MAEQRIKIWDPVVRVFHWTLVIAFFVAYFTEPEESGLALHVWAGYFVGGLIVLRVIWGFVGSRHARFSDFAFGPFRALGYLADLVRGKSRRHLGHSPAGAWMVYLLLATLTATVSTGMIVLAAERHAGPLAPFYPASTTSLALGGASAEREGDEEAEGEGAESAGEDWIEELHESLANIVLVLVILHILGVIVASAAHRENLVRSMVTGYKRDNPGSGETG